MSILLRRRAAWIMGGSVTLFGAVLWLTKVLIPPPPISDLVVYDPGPEGTEEVQKPKQKQVAKTTPPVAPPVPEVIVTASPLTTPPVTIDVDVPDSFTDNTDEPTDGSGDEPLGEEMGSGNSNGGMGTGKIGSGFAGVFYDFKKKSDGKPSPLANRRDPTMNGEVLLLESRFVNSSWNLSTFAPYFRPKMQLYASCFYMPNCEDKEATHAYDPDNRYDMKAGRWAAVYRAKVKAPVSGRFRFVGAADSAMAVRFDGKNVLFCGMHNLQNPSGWNEFVTEMNPNANKGRDMFSYVGCEPWDLFGGFAAGSVFSVKAGQWYEMQVMITEIGGGTFGFCLLIDDVDNPAKPRDKKGIPLFQLFRTAFSEPTAKEAYKHIKYKPDEDEEEGDVSTDMPYDRDSLIWEAKPMGPEVRMR